MGSAIALEPATRLLLRQIHNATLKVAPIRLEIMSLQSPTPLYTEEEWDAVLELARKETGFSHDRAMEIVQDLMEFDNFMYLVREAHNL